MNNFVAEVNSNYKVIILQKIILRNTKFQILLRLSAYIQQKFKWDYTKT